MHATLRRPRLAVTADGSGVVSHAGARLLADLADASTLTGQLSATLSRLSTAQTAHDPGRVLVDLAVAIADGGECISDIATLSLRDVHRRVVVVMYRLREGHPGHSAVLVGHGDTIRVLLACVAGLGLEAMPWHEVPNGSVTVVGCRAPRDQVVGRSLSRRAGHVRSPAPGG